MEQGCIKYIKLVLRIKRIFVRFRIKPQIKLVATISWFQIGVRDLKGQCHEIFDLWFFHQVIPPLIHGLKPFWILLRIRRDMINFRTQKSCMRCRWPRIHRACSINDTACIVHAVSLTPHAFLTFLHSIAVFHMIFSFLSCLKILLFLWCHWPRMHRACGVNDSASNQNKKVTVNSVSAPSK
jgi:hypothetical protein